MHQEERRVSSPVRVLYDEAKRMIDRTLDPLQCASFPAPKQSTRLMMVSGGVGTPKALAMMQFMDRKPSNASIPVA